MKLDKRNTPGASVTELDPGCWNLSIPAGKAGQYRWAQLDDYQHRLRKDFLWQAPLKFSLTARTSGLNLAGTWGFGLWNDPFSANLGLGGMARRLPALPNAAWFFQASEPNHLAFNDDHPVRGMLAATFAAPLIPPALLALTYPVMPLLAWPAAARIARNLLSHQVGESAVSLEVDVTAWHRYELEWQSDRIVFRIDEQECAVTRTSPRGRLGLVIWMDNQFAAFPPDGRLRFGTLANSAQWLEVKDMQITESTPAVR